MTFKPDEVQSQEFLTAIRGYDKQAVRRFLEAVANQMRETDAHIGALEDEIDVLRNERLGEAGGAEARRLTTELREQLTLVARLVAELRGTTTPTRPPAASTRPPAAPAPTAAEIGPDHREIAPASPQTPPAARQSTPAPEWEDLLADPAEGP